MQHIVEHLCDNYQLLYTYVFKLLAKCVLLCLTLCGDLISLVNKNALQYTKLSYNNYINGIK